VTVRAQKLRDVGDRAFLAAVEAIAVMEQQNAQRL
jgi:hypothetical protein